MDFGELLVKLVPFIIPAILIGSWLVNTRVTRGGAGGKEPPASKSEDKSSSKPKSDKMSDKDMTGL